MDAPCHLKRVTGTPARQRHPLHGRSKGRMGESVEAVLQHFEVAHWESGGSRSDWKTAWNSDPAFGVISVQ
jgi:hypothetical protein